MGLSVFLDRGSQAMRKAYKTDLTNAQWDLIRDLLPAVAPKPGCAPTDLREIVHALL
jgi:transposase